MKRYLGLKRRNKSESKFNIQECLQLYVSEEHLSESEAPHCSKCKSCRPAKKRMQIFRLPKVLVLHLKRFSEMSRSRRCKLNSSIECPTVSLDMSPYVFDLVRSHIQQYILSTNIQIHRFCTESNQKRKNVYNLTAVTNHVGSLFGGHYTADCLNSDVGMWYHFNDDRVQKKRQAEETVKNVVNQRSAYLLFYELQS